MSTLHTVVIPYKHGNTESTDVKPGKAKIQSMIDYIFISKELNLYLKSYKLNIPPIPDLKAVETVM